MRTAECVTPMHPDKICDRISDAILDECLKQDPYSRVAIETMGGHGIITVTGELTTKAYVNVPKVVRSIVGDKYGVQVNIAPQSGEIAQGVDTGGAGDQGIVSGYATNENDEMIPQELNLARSLCMFLYEKYPYDGKTQITLDDSGFITAIVASFQNAQSKDLKYLVEQWMFSKKYAENVKIYANPAGDWSVGGFEADTGVTGRKLVVDNYGPQIPIGGGAFSGKDATKIDRSAAYMARKIAVDLVQSVAGAKYAYVKLAYAIGVAEPVMKVARVCYMDGEQKTFVIPEGKYDLTPEGIIRFLNLRASGYETLASWGHFGRGFAWDK